MDMTKNRIPENIKTIHLTAICGTGMGALAGVLKDLGFEVTGSDHKAYPPMSDFLAEKGIDVFQGYDGSNLAHEPDLVVVGNVISRDNPEAEKMVEMGLNFCSMPQAINRFMVAYRQPILVTGTHGKTTTCSLMAWVLHTAGLDPGFMIGGILKNFNSNYRLGGGKIIVIEGDEYDTAFFHKVPKFVHFDSSLSVLTSIEFDHADIYKDMDNVKQAFSEFITSIPPEGTVAIFDGDKNIDELIVKTRGRVVRYGMEEDSAWRIGHIAVEPPWMKFELLKRGRSLGVFKTRMIGEHNLLNALAVIAVSDVLGIPMETIGQALETFEGIKRRQEVRGEKRGIAVIDDFAHHPTAVRETVRAVKPFYPSGRLIAVFEPRTNTSMRDVFQDVYPKSFDHADVVCIRKPPLLKKIPSDERFSSLKLVKDLKRRGKEAYYFEDTKNIIDFLVKTAKSGDAVLIMSNGGFDNIHERLLLKLEGLGKNK